MNAYKIELLIVDIEGIGEESIKTEIENARYPNDCVNPQVKSVERRDIGEWHDDHPLNKRDTADTEYRRLFMPNAPVSNGPESGHNRQSNDRTP